MTATNYLDYAGLQRFKTNLDTQYAGIYRTQGQVNDQIDAKLAEHETNYVQISSTVPTIAGGAREGIIYLVPDADAPAGSFKYIAYAVEDVSGEPKVVKLGTGTTEIPIVDQALEDGSTHAISNNAVYDGLALKVNTADIASSVTQNNGNPVSSGAVYTELTTNYLPLSRVTGDAPASESDNVCTSGAMYTALDLKVDKSIVTSNAPADSSTDICTSGSVYTALGLKVDVSSIASTVADDDTNVVSGDAVYEFVTSQMSNIQTITNPEIDVLFITAGQIWIDGTGWATMKAKFDSAGEFVPLTKNSSGYYVITPADVEGTVNTLVLATSDDSISTGALTDVTSSSDLNGLIGKIVGAADEATSLTILA